MQVWVSVTIHVAAAQGEGYPRNGTGAGKLVGEAKKGE